jgi:hypothetical protein
MSARNEASSANRTTKDTSHLDEDIARLQRYVTSAGRLCPDLWKQVDEARAQIDWPSWCFLPTPELERLICGMRELSPSIGRNLNAIGALAGWRVTQGVYGFDPYLFDAVWHTPLDTEIPGEVLFRLPEWCVYIMTPDCVFGRRPLRGFLLTSITTGLAVASICGCFWMWEKTMCFPRYQSI